MVVNPRDYDGLPSGFLSNWWASWKSIPLIMNSFLQARRKDSIPCLSIAVHDGSLLQDLVSSIWDSLSNKLLISVTVSRLFLWSGGWAIPWLEAQLPTMLISDLKPSRTDSSTQSKNPPKSNSPFPPPAEAAPPKSVEEPALKRLYSP